MDTNRQTKVRQILKAIEYGNIPREEIRQRLQQIIDDELSGAVEAEYDQEKVEICSDLLMRVTSGEPFPEINDTTQTVEQIAVNVEKARKRRRIAKYTLRTAAAVLVLAIGLTAIGVISPIRWFTGQSTEDEQQYIIQGHEISVQTVSTAIAEHQLSGTKSIETKDRSEFITFLGFDPDIPETVNNIYRSNKYSVLFAADYIRVNCYYMKDHQPSDDFVAKISIYYYIDPNSTYLSLEQSEEGEMISLNGTEIYRYKNMDRYGYTWTNENQVYLFITIEPPEVAEVFLQDFLKQNTATPVSERKSDNRQLQTTDAAEAIAFLGFDPGVPLSFGDCYTIGKFYINVNPYETFVRVAYAKNGTLTDPAPAFVSLRYFADMEEARLSLQQDEEGESITICGVSVYRYTNSGWHNYSWTRDNMVALFHTQEPTEIAEQYVREFINSMAESTRNFQTQ